MKIALLKRSSLSYPDGISHFIFSLAEALLQQGHEVVCLTTDDNALDEVASNYDLTRYPRMHSLAHEVRKPKTIRTSGELYRHISNLWLRYGRAWMDTEKPDLIVLNGFLPVRFRQPSSGVAHDSEPRQLIGNLGRKLFKAFTYRLVDQLIVTCPELAEPVAHESFLRPESFRVIPTCLNTSSYTPVRLSERQPLILHMGAQEYKQPAKTIQAFCAMKNTSPRLILVGNIPHAIAQQVQQLPAHLQERIDLPGVVSAARLKELLCSARVVSVPSNYHIPVASPTVLESMAAHTPAVVSHSITRIIVKDGENCLMAGSAEEMATAFDRLCADDSLWAKISAGCERTKVRFASTTVAQQYIHLAEELQRKASK